VSESVLAQLANMPPVNEFVPGQFPQIKLNSTITVYGKRGTGKSFFVRWFMDSYKDYFPWGWVFTKTKHNDQYQIMMPDKYIIKDFSCDILEKIMKRQLAARAHYEKQDDSEEPFNPLAYVIWDDYMGDDIKFNAKLYEYYCLGRHYGTMNFYCAQHRAITPPVIRQNTDLAILFNSDAHQHLEGLAEDFAGKYPKKVYSLKSFLFSSE